eukprot:CAMPEP_0172545518 /NCGR_PEP_ID=MMETSP1067-20121228/15427_1 /TAXON_ID=265564 ORGANISM="Thalassiosira punctigera, Strain Tpunct2005C2" /NCGR_SAMPLE_ID=MMETSP1067 /ASSEMBLY_ACC=CAM_ASM_000444 /LENGTH=57 /DNA_ID=CAMNT_0013332275 /DNA_START=63 /DNA_END=233 /DNA_ORIENTATION=+
MPFGFGSIATAGRQNNGRQESSTAPTIPPSLTRQCLQLHQPDQKISNDAVELSSEFL